MPLSSSNPSSEFLLYTAPSGQVKVEVILQDETIWMPQKKMAELFGVQVPAISKYLDNIFDSGELQEQGVVSILEIIADDGKTFDFEKMTKRIASKE